MNRDAAAIETQIRLISNVLLLQIKVPLV